MRLSDDEVEAFSKDVRSLGETTPNPAHATTGHATAVSQSVWCQQQIPAMSRYHENVVLPQGCEILAKNRRQQRVVQAIKFTREKKEQLESVENLSSEFSLSLGDISSGTFLVEGK